jgi:hypothetical protein
VADAFVERVDRARQAEQQLHHRNLSSANSVTSGWVQADVRVPL